MNPADYYGFLPIIVLVGWACVLLLVDLFIPADRKAITAILSALGLIAAMAVTIYQSLQYGVQPPASSGMFNNMAVFDGFGLFFEIVVLVSGLIGVAIAYDYLKRLGMERGEYYSLLLFTVSGMMLMAMAADLIVVFLALELLSFPLYILSGFARPRPESEEAALKYFLLGAFSSGFVVYGVALVFGATGTTGMVAVAKTIAGSTANLPLLLIGAALIFIGLGFKVAAVPFHMWTPDVYQGAPTPIVAFMAVGAKVGGFAALLRIFFAVFPSLAGDIAPVIWVVSALTMIVGNFLAITQTNIKRLLAYSSIAHAGYILMALVPFGRPEMAGDAVASALFYVVAYAVSNFTAWAVVIALEKAEGLGLELEDYAGLARKYPWLAAAMATAMLSFTGVPPMLGFVGKFFLFRTAIQGGYIGLAIIGVLTSLISAYYYLRVVVIMYMRDGDPVARSEAWLNITVVGSAAASVLLTIFSPPLFAWAAGAILKLF